MRKPFIMILFVATCSFFLFASVDTSEMTQIQLKAFYQKMLTIEEHYSTSSTVSGSIRKISESTAIASSHGESQTSTNWTPYEGARKISKTEFFKITEENELYLQSVAIDDRISRKKKSGLILSITGGATMVAGFVMFGIGISQPNYESISDALNGPLCNVGLILALGSSIPLGIGFANLGYREDIDVSTSFAIGIADLYNQKLAAEIKVSY